MHFCFITRVAFKENESNDPLIDTFHKYRLHSNREAGALSESYAIYCCSILYKNIEKSEIWKCDWIIQSICILYIV